MTHKDFFNNVQKLCQVDATHCSVLLNSLCRLMSQAAVEQVPVVVHGLGKFLSHKHPEYIQEDPQTGQQTLFPPRISYRLYTEEEALVNNEKEKNDSDNDILEIQLAEQAKMSVHEAKCFIDALSETINQALNAGEEVEVHGLGTFRIVESRQGELHRIAYTPDEQMRNAVNAPFSCFEPVIIKATKEAASTTSLLIQNEPIDEPIEFQDEKNESMEENKEPIAGPQTDSIVEGQPEPAADKQNPEPEPAADKQNPEPEPAADEQNPEPEPAPKQPRAEAEPVSISQHYQEFADEEKKTPIIRLLSVLLILACAALGWFIYKLEHPSVKFYNREIIEHAVVSDEQVEIDTTETGGEELFFGDSNNAAEEATAQAEADRLAAEKIAAEKAEADRLAAEKLAAEKAEAERIAAEKIAAEKKAAEKAAKEKAANEQKQPSPAQTAIAGRLKKADGSYATHKLGQGGRLTLVALEHYGDKVFWPYIYEVNRDKLSNPSLVQPGMVLYLPDPKYFGINANDPNSVAKAKAKAAQYLK